MTYSLIRIEQAWIQGDVEKRDALLAEEGLTLQAFEVALEAQKVQAWERLNQCRKTLGSSLIERIRVLTEHFLGTPYGLVIDILTPWHHPDIAQNQCVRVDCFDCVTFVEMVLALASYTGEEPLPSAAFYAHLYRWMFIPNTAPDSFTRHRFIDGTWLHDNATWLTDCTRHLPFAIEEQSHVLGKGGVIAKQLENFSEAGRDAAYFPTALREAMLKDAKVYPAMEIVTPYIPLKTCIEEYSALEHYLRSQPEAVYVLTVISDAPHLPRLVGSAYHVTHLGFLLIEPQGLRLRHATSIAPHAVVDIALIDYATLRYQQIVTQGFSEKAGKVKGFGLYRIRM